MEMQTLIEVLSATHLSSRVEGPMHGYGGIMLVGPPEALKSTLLAVVDKRYDDCMVFSDLNVKTLVRLTGGPLATGAIRTLVFPELAKLYERQGVTSSNLEGAIRALVAEGFSAASFQEPGINRFTARATVLAAMTPSMLEQKGEYWNDSGFTRRFLWCLIKLENPEVLQMAIDKWESLSFGNDMVISPPTSGEFIPNLTTEEERKALRGLLKYQPPHGGDHILQRQMLVRILAVLKWHYAKTGRNPAHSMKTVVDFSEALGRYGTAITLPSQVWIQNMARRNGKRYKVAKKKVRAPRKKSRR